MSEVIEQKKSFDAGRRMRQAIGLGGAGLLLGGLAAPWWFTHHETHTEIAANEVGITPNFEGIIHIKSGIIVPDSRIKSDSILGLDITVGNTTITGEGMTSDITDRLTATYGGVATNPDAEIEKVRDIVKDQAIMAGIVGGGAALLPTIGYLLIGKRRREELADTLWRVHAPAIGGAALCIVAGVGVVQSDEPATVQNNGNWIPLSEAIPGASSMPELDTVEVKNNAMTGITRSLLEGAIQTYEKSKPFYDELKETVKANSAEFRTPEDDETVALFVSDRHDNIAMDPVLRATADEAGATIVITGGDDTSSGKSWEAFSLRSLNNNFEDMTRIGVGGNHDNGTFVVTTLEDYGFAVPNGEVQTIEGISIAMANDPRKSDYTPEKREGEIPYDEAGEQLAEQACSGETGRVNLVITHSASMGETALEEGCADLVVGGHSHSYSEPTPIRSNDGDVGYTVTNGTSGGALFAFAAGTKLKREANALLITFSAEGKPVATQNVRYLPSGEVIVEDFLALQLLTDNSNAGASDVNAQVPKQKDNILTPTKKATNPTRQPSWLP